MNKFTILVVMLFFLVMGVLFYAPESGDGVNKADNEKIDVRFIKPPEIIEPNTDVKHNNVSTAVNFFESKNITEKRKRMNKSSNIETYEYPFTAEGQAYKTLGEVLLKNKKDVDTTKFSANLFKQIEQAKYNLKLAKEIASMSKNLYIKTDEGNVIDQEVYAKINELSKNLIVAVKKQQNIK